MRKFFRENGLTIAMVALFLFALLGQWLTGYRAHCAEQTDHRQMCEGLVAYTKSPHFLQALAENWESEFLQMAVYVWLTAFLHQKGSAESKPLDDHERDDEMDPKPDAPSPVHRGGVVKAIYARSLSLSLFALFLFSFVLHAFAGRAKYNDDQLAHGGSTVGVLGFVQTAQFWFESFQNWQSEFMSVAAIVVLSIWLRQKGSPESKPVNAPHEATGE